MPTTVTTGRKTKKGISLKTESVIKKARKTMAASGSLNGERTIISSRHAVIDRYKNHDMPLGWLLPERRLRSRIRTDGNVGRQHRQSEKPGRLRPKERSGNRPLDTVGPAPEGR